MSEQELPESEHVVRYVPRRLIGELCNIDPQAFMLREADMEEDPPGVSVSWLEYTGHKDKLAQLTQIREWSELTFTLRKSGRFAELNVGDVIAKIAGKLDDAKVVHKPEENPSHTLIIGLPSPEELEAGEEIGLMISQCVLELYPGEL